MGNGSRLHSCAKNPDMPPSLFPIPGADMPDLACVIIRWRQTFEFVASLPPFKRSPLPERIASEAICIQTPSRQSLSSSSTHQAQLTTLRHLPEGGHQAWPQR